MKKALKRIGLGLLLLFVVAVGLLLIVSPQSTPAINGDHSIALVEDVELNGVKQRIVIRGKDRSNPILLHLHGGPGGPDLAFWQHYGLDIEDIFTVCYWDQRGAGASYHQDLDPATMTLEQLARDGNALSQMLINRFDKEKIYLQGHSFGTAVATHMAHQSPDLFHAYIGIGQMANLRLSEQRSFDFALDECIAAGDEDGAQQLRQIGRPPYANSDLSIKNLFIQRPIMQRYENPNNSTSLSMFEIYKIFALYRGYSISDKLKAIKALPFSMRTLWPQIEDLNFNYQFPNWDIPVYIIQGKYDQHTVTSIAKEYFDYIIAPKKGYFEFEGSAHNPHFNEQKRYREVLQQILQRAREN